MTSTSAADRQRLDTLAAANRTRCARSRLKKEIADGTLTLAAALLDERAAGMQAFDILRHQRQWGRVKAAKALELAGLDWDVLVGELSGEQVAVLCSGRRVLPLSGAVLDRSQKTCRSCGVWLVEATPDMVCGFCEGLWRKGGEAA